MNPAHMEPVTRQVNVLRGDTVAARRAAVTHCNNGHPYDAANTYRNRYGRHCRACGRMWTKAYLERKRARLAS